MIIVQMESFKKKKKVHVKRCIELKQWLMITVKQSFSIGLIHFKGEGHNFFTLVARNRIAQITVFEQVS